MKVKKVKNTDGTFRLVDENGKNLELDTKAILTGETIHICFKTDMEEWEIADAAKQYGLEVIEDEKPKVYIVPGKPIPIEVFEMIVEDQEKWSDILELISLLLFIIIGSTGLMAKTYFPQKWLISN